MYVDPKGLRQDAAALDRVATAVWFLTTDHPDGPTPQLKKAVAAAGHPLIAKALTTFVSSETARFMADRPVDLGEVADGMRRGAADFERAEHEAGRKPR